MIESCSVQRKQQGVLAFKANNFLEFELMLVLINMVKKSYGLHTISVQAVQKIITGRSSSGEIGMGEKKGHITCIMYISVKTSD